MTWSLTRRGLASAAVAALMVPHAATAQADQQALVDRAQRGLAQAVRRASRVAPPPPADDPPQPDTSMVDESGERLTDDISSGTGA